MRSPRSVLERGSLPRFVGRETELARAVRALSNGASSIVITGEPGVGKTRLAREVLASVDEPATATAWVTATRASLDIPLGAFSGLLGDAALPSDDRSAMLRTVRRELLERAAHDRLVLAVDDVDLLDETSFALLPLLTDSGEISLVMTHRTDVRSQALADLVGTTRSSVRLDLEPLDREPAANLVEQLLGSRLVGSSFDRLWQLSRGNPLYLQEFALAAWEHGMLHHTANGVELDGTPPPSRRLVEIVGVRLEGLAREQRELLEMLALNEPVGVDLLSDDADESTLEELEARRLVTVEVRGRRREARLGHPVYGEVLRDGLPHTRRERLSAELADRLEATGLARHDDPLALVRLRIAADEPSETHHLLAAGRRALTLFDHQQAATLARRARRGGAGADADLLLGEALTNLGETEAADAVLSDIGWDAGEEPAARAALIRARNLLFSSGEASRAQAVVEDALEHVSSAPWRGELTATLALCLGVSGDFRSASEAGKRVVTQADVGDRGKLSVLVVSTLADALLGRLEKAHTGIDEGLELVPGFEQELPFAEHQLQVNRLLLLWHAGDLQAAGKLGRRLTRRAVEDGAVDPAVLYGVFLAMIALETGRPHEAFRLCRDGLERGRERSIFGATSSALALQARAAAALGDLDTAERTLQELAPHREQDVRARIHGSRAETWLLGARGELTRAAELAAAEGAWVVSTSHVVWGAFTLYDAVRFGRPGLVRYELTSLAAEVEGDLVATMADHARARDQDDADALDDVSARLAAMGCFAYAAEAAGHAAESHVRTGRPARARRSSTSAALLAEHCQGRGFPLLGPLTHEPLTAREQEIARMAAAGATSREIAEQLVLSVRTVDNHLASVYRKTGVSGRDELADVLSVARSDATE